MDYGLLVKDRQMVDGVPVEVTIEKKKIVAVATTISGSAKETIHLRPDTYVSAGWIDDHVRCSEKMALYYDYPDEAGVRKGVTTIIDVGATDAESTHEFYDLAQQAKINVFGLVNTSKWDTVAQSGLVDLSKVQASLVKKVIQGLPDFVVGIRVCMSGIVIGDNGTTPLELARQIQQENQETSLVIHIGSTPLHLDGILALMEKGDILAHCFNGKEDSILDQVTDKTKDFTWQAYNKGVVFNTGHGTDSFSFRVVGTALHEGMKATSINADTYTRNRGGGPAYDLATTMGKPRVVGCDWSEVIEKVTKFPAEGFHLAQRDTLKIGKDIDLAIFMIQTEEKTLTDSNGLTRVTEEQVRPIRTTIGGQIYDNQLREAPLKRSH